MSLKIRSLNKSVLPGTTETDVYVAPVGKSVIVKSIRLVNTGASSATVNLFIRRATGGTSFRIVPKDLTIAPGAAFIDDFELTLEGLDVTGNSDRIRATTNSGATVDCVMSGVERDEV